MQPLYYHLKKKKKNDRNYNELLNSRVNVKLGVVLTYVRAKSYFNRIFLLHVYSRFQI